MFNSRSYHVFLLPAVAVLACDLTEVEIPQGEPTVVVQAVMRPDLNQQFIVLEESFTGTVDYEFKVDAIIPIGGSPKKPIDGAVVTVANLDLPSDSCGNPVLFTRKPQAPLLFEMPGVYWGPPSCPTMRPGDRLELRVATTNGDTVSGTTSIPGMEGASLAIRADTLPFGSDSAMLFDRDQDTLRVWLEALAGRLMQLEIRRTGVIEITGAERLERGAKIFADTTALSVPGDALDVFGGGTGYDLFQAGRYYMLTAALSDINYYDFARSANNDFTGRGFINRLSGGTGVFGSLVATATPLKTTGVMDDEREGVYRLQGQVQGIDVDAELTIYLARSLEDAELSGFLNGDWVTTASGPGGAKVWVSRQVDLRSVEGSFEGQLLTVIVMQPAFEPGVMRQVLRGIRISGVPFRVTMADSAGLSSRGLGTLTATQR